MVNDTDGDDGASPSRERPPAESLTPLAGRVLDVIVAHAYDLSSAVEAIDAAVPGIGGLFDPTTDRATLTAAVERVLAGAATQPQQRAADAPAPTPDPVGRYAAGSARRNPGPAGAGEAASTGAGSPSDGGPEMPRSRYSGRGLASRNSSKPSVSPRTVLDSSSGTSAGR